MAANFTLTRRTNGPSQVMSGQAYACVDQAPTGSWAEVNFGTFLFTDIGNGERVVHVDTDVAFRMRAALASPAGGDAGTQVQSGSARTIQLSAEMKLWIK